MPGPKKQFTESYYQRNRDTVLKKQAEYYTNNRAKVALRNRNNRRRAIAGYGGKCACCGESRFEFLAIDHVNGGGHKERQAGMNPRRVIAEVLRDGFPSKYQVLCHNCNLAKGFYGQCPHVSEALNASAC